MKVRFMCTDGTWLGVDNVNMDKLREQCYCVAKQKGKVPTNPLVWERVPEPVAATESAKGDSDDENNGTPKEEWIQLQFDL